MGEDSEAGRNSPGSDTSSVKEEKVKTRWGWKKIVFFLFVVACVVTAIVVPIVLLSTTMPTDKIVPKKEERIPCLLGSPRDQEACEAAGCIFDSAAEENLRCFFPNRYGLGYEVKNITQDDDAGLEVSLKRLSNKTPYGKDAETLIFEATYYSDHLVGIRLQDPENEYSRRPPVSLNLPTAKTTAKSRNYEVKVNKDTTGESLTVVVQRSNSGEILFDTTFTGMVVSKQYLQWATKLPSDRLYGIGESNRPRFKHDMNYKTWALSARDQPPGGEENLYGVHPFYMAFDNSGQAHGVLLLNSHVMEVTTLPLPGLAFRALGGWLEFFIFVGPSAEDVVKSYHNVIGLPYFPAYWGLGFQLSRYGYNSLASMEMAINRTRKYGIPLDVQHLDIDYMDRRVDFTYDKENFAGLPDFITKNKEEYGLKFITIIHPAITSNETNYLPYEEGLRDEVFVVWANKSLATEGQDVTQGEDAVMLGYLWPPGKAAFPDFFKSNTRAWWSKQIKDFHNQIAFDGIWTDMNEPANFGTNEEKPFNWPEGLAAWSLKCPTDNDWENPPYKTRAGAFGPTNRISDKTLCMVAALGDNKKYLFYEVHNLYGYSQAEPTYQVSTELDTERKRSVVITRSTYPGSGQYAGHWLGDNTSEFPFILRTVVGLLDFNIFGIPYVGSDICGYFGNATESLCRRWMVNGAFHPFSRNHNGNGNIDQDPGVWPSVAKASRNALMIRYTLLPYLYNLFFRVHREGGTVVRPVHHEFSGDAKTYDLENQFMWGDALMFAHFYETSENYVRTVYLPDDVWYFYKTGTRIEVQEPILVQTTEEEPIIFVRSGRIIPTQRPAQSTHLSRTNPMGLIIALDQAGNAQGYFYWDNGHQLELDQNKDKYFDCHMMYSSNKLEFHTINRDPTSTLDPILSDIRIMGVQSNPLPLRVSVNGAAWSKGDWHYNEVTKELSFYDMEIPIKTLNSLQWTTVVDELVVECPVSYKVRNEDGSIPQTECERVGCTWEVSADLSKPSCSLPVEHRHLYTIGSRGVTPMANNRGFTAHLVKSNAFTIHDGDFDEVNFNIWYLDNKSLRFNFEVPNEERFVPPVPLHLPNGQFDPNNNEYEFVFGSETVGEPFHFKIKRKSTGAVLFDTSVGGFFYADQFMSISTLLPSKNIYGMGENMHLSFRHDLGFHTWPAFGRDQPPSNGNEDGAKNLNLYGSHPFYECVENDGNTHGVFLFSASALDYQLLPYPGITYRTISGMLDFYVFLGPKPEEVISQYTALIGRPALVPYWSLGFQLSKYGYENLETLQEAVRRTLEADIPLDVQYLDIDHMDNQAIFTLSPSFTGLQEFINDTKQTGLRWIPILDPFVDTERGENYATHKRALAADIYFKWPDASYVAEGTDYYEDYLRLNSTALLGYVWPVGKSAFPNFLDEAAQSWWHNEILEWKRDMIDFDGLWIDMNEPANFDTNKEKPWNWDAQRPEEEPWNLICPENKWDDPPYVTKAALWTGCDNKTFESCHRRMSDKTICMFAIHGNETHLVRHYDTHNLYGWSETPITKKAAEDATGTRSVVITRSTFPSTGTAAGHWLGDNASIWPDMHRSIIGMLEFNLFGIPYIGADVCGFFFNTTEELCNRWMQLGSFYPFSRNHNTYEGRPLPQDPGYWPNTVGESSRRALRIRYKFLPYLYTLFYEAHTTGATVVRPLHHEFPLDRNTLIVDSQFLWGPAFLISPIMEEGALSRPAYLPDDTWYEFHSKAFEPITGTTIDITPADNWTVPLHLRGGYIFPTQRPEGSNTAQTRQQPMGLVITVGRERTAKGSLYWDDGEAIDPITTGNYHLSEFSFTEDQISNTVLHRDDSNSVFGDTKLEDIEIWGYEFEITGVTLNNQALEEVTITKSGEFVTISGLSLDLQEDFTLGLVRN